MKFVFLITFELKSISSLILFLMIDNSTNHWIQQNEFKNPLKKVDPKMINSLKKDNLAMQLEFNLTSNQYTVIVEPCI